MKKLLLFVTMAASLLFTQCKKEESVSSAGKTVRMTVTVGPGSKTDITDAGAITWSTGDKLYVGDGTQYIGYLTLKSGAGSATGVFTGNVTLTYEAEVDSEEMEVEEPEPEPEDESGKGDGQTFHFFYLGSVDHTSDLEKDPTLVGVNFSNQNIQKGKEGEPLQNASGFHVGYGKANGTVTEDGMVTDINVRMVSKVALAHFNIKKDDAGYSAPLILSGDNICNHMKVNFDSAEFSCEGIEGTISYAGADGNGDCYVMLVPTSSTTGPQTLTFTNTDGDLSGTATLDNILPNKFYGKNQAIEVTLEAAAAPKFTVDTDGTTVEFAPGNLWWDSKQFHFESNQWNYSVGEWDEDQESYIWDPNHVSHFKWSNAKNAVTSDNEYSGDLFCASNFTVTGDSHTDWRTLSEDEWGYLLGFDPTGEQQWDYGRDNAEDLCAWVTLTDVKISGLVILPDDTEEPSTVMSSITLTSDLASYGAIFLPASGVRDGENVNLVNSYGYYWSSTPNNELNDYALMMRFFDPEYLEDLRYSRILLVADGDRYYGHSVRLVRDAE